MRVAALRIGAEPEGWRDLGFDVSPEGTVELDNTRLELSASAKRGEIESWALEGASLPEEIDGLPTDAGVRSEPGAGNPNGARDRSRGRSHAVA